MEGGGNLIEEGEGDMFGDLLLQEPKSKSPKSTNVKKLLDDQ
jgi:hypothetical protein